MNGESLNPREHDFDEEFRKESQIVAGTRVEGFRRDMQGNSQCSRTVHAASFASQLAWRRSLRLATELVGY